MSGIESTDGDSAGGDKTSPVRKAAREFESHWKVSTKGEETPPNIERYMEGWETPERGELLRELLRIEGHFRRELREEFLEPNDYYLAFKNEPDRAIIDAFFFGPRFRKAERIGYGSYGVTYKAYEAKLKWHVAIKVPKRVRSIGDEEYDAFLAEAQNLASLQHTNIVRFLGFATSDGFFPCYLLCEYIEGESLAKVVDWARQNQRTIDQREAASLIAEIANALAYAHKKSVVHRDVKPANIVLERTLFDYILEKRGDRTGKAVLLDFGMALDHRDRDAGRDSRGTLVYMSPEQAGQMANSVTGSSDVYSLGVVLYELLSNKLPFEPKYDDDGSISAESLCKFLGQVADKKLPPPNPRDANQDIDPKLATICLEAIAKRPEDRFTAADFRDKLDKWRRDSDAPRSEFARAGTTGAPLDSSPARPLTITSRLVMHRTSLILTALVCLIALGGFFAFRGHRPPEPICFGITAGFDGQIQDLASHVRDGIDTYFSAVNASGGINGRPLKLVIFNDEKDPKVARENIHKMFDKSKVSGMIGILGTESAISAADYANHNQVLLFAPISGAAALRKNPPDRYVFNYRAAYAQEIAKLVDHFKKVKRVQDRQIAAFLQDDSYGKDGKAALQKILGWEPQVIAWYPRNTVEVAAAIRTVKDHQPDVRAIIMVATARAAAQFIKGLHQEKIQVHLGAVSVAGEELYRHLLELGLKGDDVYPIAITQVVPNVHLSQLKCITSYKRDIAEFHGDSGRGYGSFEGYLAAMLLVDALRKAYPDLSSEHLISTLESMNYDELDLGTSSKLQFTPTRHQASDNVWLTELEQDGSFRDVDLNP
jgi:serine/threonine protein kinase